DGGLAGAGMANDGEGLPLLDAEGDVAQDPVFVLGICAAGISKPNIAEFNFTARSGKSAHVNGGDNGERLVEQLEDTLGGGHGGLEDIELVAQVLNGAEEALGVNHEGEKDADLDLSGN